ncbi:unnamed protein product [Brugia timori]|uniref:Uncharacterized protein n=1 Tax=Brugia timori TaxID=42155 RepID=A0A0R3R3C2_9BILA|nr:unnamed protein product [Brugia timori]
MLSRLDHYEKRKDTFIIATIIIYQWCSGDGDRIVRTVKSCYSLEPIFGPLVF